jgi:hypothetical protein
METKIYNIDSSINRINTENSNNFTYTLYTISYINKIDKFGNNIRIPVTNIEPFNEKNVYEINILSFEFNEIFDIIKAELDPVLYPLPPLCKCGYPFDNCICVIPVINIDTRIVIEPTSITEPVIIARDPVIEPSSIFTPVIPIVDNGLVIEPISITEPIINPIINTGRVIEPNAIVEEIIQPLPEIDITEDLSFHKTTTYFFLRINDFGNITNFNKKNGNIKYVAKIVVEKLGKYNPYTYRLITTPIYLEQPIDIKFLKISLENKDGDLVGSFTNHNGFTIDYTKYKNYSFTMELKIITNSILKDYKQIRFYSEPVMERLLQSKMLSFFEKRVDAMTNNTLANNYMSNLVNLNNVEEYTPLGNRNNYMNPNTSSLYTNMDKRM